MARHSMGHHSMAWHGTVWHRTHPAPHRGCTVQSGAAEGEAMQAMLGSVHHKQPHTDTGL